MADADVDIIGALVALLSADAGVLATQATVHGVELPHERIADMPVNALVIVPAGGPQPTQPSKANLESQRFDLFSYGKSHWAADSLRRVASAALSLVERKVVTLPSGVNVLVHAVQVAGGFYASRDRDGAWPNSWQSFTTIYATKEV